MSQLDVVAKVGFETAATYLRSSTGWSAFDDVGNHEGVNLLRRYPEDTPIELNKG